MSTTPETILNHPTAHSGWIGVDLDGTLAHYDGWKGVDHIGEPIGPMVERVKQWLAEGKDVRIFTARVAPPPLARGESVLNPANLTNAMRSVVEAMVPIQIWCVKQFGRPLPITYKKDNSMFQLWDDRAVCVERNTGRILGQNPETD